MTYPPLWYPTTLFLIKKLTSQQKKFGNEPSTWNPLVLPEAADFTEWLYSLLKTQLQHQLGDNILQG